MTFREMKTFWDRKEEGGRKSFRIEELDPGYYLRDKISLLPFLEGLQHDLDEREEEA